MPLDDAELIPKLEELIIEHFNGKRCVDPLVRNPKSRFYLAIRRCGFGLQAGAEPLSSILEEAGRWGCITPNTPRHCQAPAPPVSLPSSTP
jgi:hypothetical protein